MDEHAVRTWLRDYLADFTALGRGDSDDVRRLLVHYAVPAVLSTDSGCVSLTDEEQVLTALHRQVDGVRATGYDRSEEVAGETTVVNRTCALHHATFARLRADGTEIGRIETTYVLTDGPAGPRISALLVHSAG